MATMSLSRTASEINGNFRGTFLHPAYFAFAPPIKEFPFELGIGAGVKKTRMTGYRVEKKV